MMCDFTGNQTEVEDDNLASVSNKVRNRTSSSFHLERNSLIDDHIDVE